MKLDSNLWARFYELGTDRAIYVGHDGVVHYDISGLTETERSEYSWQGDFSVNDMKGLYDFLVRVGPDEYVARAFSVSEPTRAKLETQLQLDVVQVMGQMDPMGRWVRSDGRIYMADAHHNLNTIYLLHKYATPSQSMQSDKTGSNSQCVPLACRQEWQLSDLAWLKLMQKYSLSRA